jgi:hypothetical protein
MNGRLSTDFYAYQRSDDDHLRPYVRFWGDAMAWGSREGRFIRMHTSLRWTSDFTNQLPTDPQLFVFDAYVQFSGVPPRTDLYLGRQFVYSGVGSALMDGGRVRVRPVKYLDLELFGGSAVSSEDPETVNSLEDRLVVGGRLGARPDGATRLGLNWMLRHRDGQAAYHRLGIDGSRVFGPAEIYGRVSYDVVDHRLADIMARAIYRPGAWYVSGEYYWREPLVASNTIFAIVDFYRYQIGRVELRRRVWRRLSLATHVQATESGGDESWRIGIGFASPTLSLAWIHQTGYAGDNDGVSGYFNLPLNDSWMVYATANLFRYRVQLEQTDRSDAYATTLGLRWRLAWGFAIRAEGQFLRNAVYEDDTRIFLRISKDFSVGTQSGRKEL